ncbi:MAG: ABC transporter permease [Firmicutes bacterium]|nr:ABC transporter permease [Bacillota bacterium]
MKVRLEKRVAASPVYRFFSPVLAVIMALIFGAVFLWASGFNPAEVYLKMWWGAFGDSYGISETVVKAIPIMLCALGIALAARMLLWNVGAEGQFYMGAVAASWVALSMRQAPAWQVLPLMALAGMAGGALWALVPAIPRALLGVNEIITTLMLNYVAIHWVEYLVHGPWRDPGSLNFPLSAPFSRAARLPMIGDTRVHAGLLFGLAAATLLTFVLWRTKWGYEVRVIGENPRAARYAGMNITRNVMIVLCAAGALAGLAGMAEVSAIAGRMQKGLSPGYGYSAIIVAWLAKLSPWGIVVVSILFGGLLVGGYSAQFIGVSAASVNMLQGAMLFFVLAAEVMGRYRIRVSLSGAGVDASSSRPAGPVQEAADMGGERARE